MPGLISDPEDFDLSHASLASLSLIREMEKRSRITQFWWVFFLNGERENATQSYMDEDWNLKK